MLKKDLPLVMGLIAEQLRDPAFKAEEFEKVKQKFEGWIEQYDDRYRIPCRRVVLAPRIPTRPPQSPVLY